jgi:hypothetical protein
VHGISPSGYDVLRDSFTGPWEAASTHQSSSASRHRVPRVFDFEPMRGDRPEFDTKPSLQARSNTISSPPCHIFASPIAGSTAQQFALFSAATVSSTPILAGSDVVILQR